MTAKLQTALAALNAAIKAGREFPDAAFSIAQEYKVGQERLEAAYDALSDEDDYEYRCPKCGGHRFRIYVQQRVFVEFGAAGDHDVYDGPEGDMEWDDDSEAICDDCDHYGPLGKMK